MELWTAFLLGLAGSLHCAGMCGPLVLALAKAAPATPGQDAGRICHHVGRVISYALLGIVLGFIGHIAAPDGFQRWLSIALGCALLVSLTVAAKAYFASPIFKWVGLLTRALHARLQRSSLYGHVLIGALNGLLPCGLVYVAAVGATATGHPLSGAAYMALFGLGTWPMMLGVHFAGHRLRIPSRLSFGNVARAAVLLMGVLLILRGLELGIPFVSPDVSSASPGDCHCH